MAGKPIDLTSKRFGRLLVKEQIGKDKHGRVLWLCQCDCGNTHIAAGTNLRTGKTKSCGCFNRDQKAELARINFTKHGESAGSIYNSWAAMIQRCTNKNTKSSKNYGGRGIKVCEEWKESAEFIRWSKENGYTKGMTLDRIDVDGDYTPHNCRWATRKTQARNQRPKRSINGQPGVHRLKSGNYEVRIYEDKGRRHIGTYATLKEAAEAYQRAKEERDKKQG